MAQRCELLEKTCFQDFFSVLNTVCLYCKIQVVVPALISRVLFTFREGKHQRIVMS